MLDRAKTVLFDMLGHRLEAPGRLPPLAVLDLFAGSGALGLEALSRGARYCLFVERHRPTAAVLRQNLDTFGALPDAEVIQADATVCEFPAPPASPDLPASYELIFIDPPYRMMTGPAPNSGVRMLLGRLATEAVIAPSAMIVVRHQRRADGGPDLQPLTELARRDVGGMTLRFLSPRPAEQTATYGESP